LNIDLVLYFHKKYYTKEYSAMRNFVILLMVCLAITACHKHKKHHHGGHDSNIGTLQFSSHTANVAPNVELAPLAKNNDPEIRLDGEPLNVDFNMGSLNKTSTYLFELVNTGSTDMTNISLETNNAAVTISPSIISVLSPSNSGSVVPIIQVTVQHGLSANGIGTAPTLTAGELAFNIYATTLGANASTHPDNYDGGIITDYEAYGGENPSATSSIGVNVKIASLVMTTGFQAGPGVVCNYTNIFGEQPTLTDTNGVVTVQGWHLDNIHFWGDELPPDVQQGGQIQIVNNGNTTLTVDIYDFPLPGDQIIFNKSVTTYTIAPGAAQMIDPVIKYQQPLDVNYQYSETLMRIRGTGAVFSSDSLQPDSTGTLWVEVMAGCIVAAG
jgi:hypothetical protein